jgi:hypothetical protein
MKVHTANIGAARALIVAWAGSSASAHNAPDTVGAHLVTARNAAGFDFPGPWHACALRLRSSRGFGILRRGARPRATLWFTEPAKVFDNLYFVGSNHSSWALTTNRQ